MASGYDEYSEERIAKLRRVNDLLKRALELVETTLRDVEEHSRETGQDNEPPDATQASPPSA
jgi:hypothetical protein